MKKLLFCAVALASMFFAASCQQENFEPVNNGKVTFTVTAPGDLDTRAIADGMNVTEVHYAVYKNVEGVANSLYTPSEKPLAQGYVPMSDKKATLELDLLQDQDYTILFWAQVKDAGHYELGDLREVKIVSGTETDPETGKVYQTVNANDETRAAFFRRYDFNTTTTQNYEVTLYRPFAQINLGTTHASLNPVQPGQQQGYSIDVQESEMVIEGIASSFDLIKGEGNDETNLVVNYKYTSQATPEKSSEDLTVNGTDYHYVAMNYLLVPILDKTVTVSYKITTDKGDIYNTINNVPVKENYRTNIIGNLLTSKTDFEIIVDERFVDSETGELNPDIIVEAWNGTDVKMPKQSTEDPNVYEIEYPSELAWLSAAVNGTLPDTKANLPADAFKGKTFKLTKDVDLAGKEWTPIGNSTNKFQGTFDGNGKKVMNLVITGNNSYVGLFGFTTDGEIKNLTVENAKVSGRLGVGVVAGSPYTSKYTDITVTGHIEVNGMAYVGGVGGRNAYASWTDITVNADETSYVKANSVENGTAYRTYVGGVIGFIGEDPKLFKNITSNIDVTGSTIDVGGLFGIAHYGNQFENCSCSGNVEITGASDAADAEEIGGIAGVWNNGGADVTFTNCSFTGTLKANITEGVNLSNNKIVGSAYSKTGKGRLIIDGKRIFVASTTGELQASLDAIEGGENVVYIDAALVAETPIVFTEKSASVIVDGSGLKFDGQIKIKGNSNDKDGSTLLIENICFETSTAGREFIWSNDSSNGSFWRYAENVTIKKCTFTAVEGSPAVHTAVGAKFQQSYNINMVDCVATNLHTLLQAQSCGSNVGVLDCKVVNGKNGVSFGNTTTASISGTEISALGYGVRVDGTTAHPTTLTVNNCDFAAYIPVIARKIKANTIQTVTLEGTNTFTEGGAYDIAICYNEYESGVAPIAPTGTYIVNGADGYVVYPEYDFKWENVEYSFDYTAGSVEITPVSTEGTTVYRGVVSDGKAPGITSVAVADGITRLNNRCFCKSPDLKQVTLPNSLTYIDESVFQQSGITSLTIPENVTYIGKQALGACGSLETLIVNAKNVTIANYVARACAKLKDVYFYSDSVTFESGSMYFTNKENGDASGITFYVKTQEIADTLYTAFSTSHSYGLKIVSLDGNTTYYNTLK